MRKYINLIVQFLCQMFAFRKSWGIAICKVHVTSYDKVNVVEFWHVIRTVDCLTSIWKTLTKSIYPSPRMQFVTSSIYCILNRESPYLNLHVPQLHPGWGVDWRPVWYLSNLFLDQPPLPIRSQQDDLKATPNSPKSTPWNWHVHLWKGLIFSRTSLSQWCTAPWQPRQDNDQNVAWGTLGAHEQKISGSTAGVFGTWITRSCRPLHAFRSHTMRSSTQCPVHWQHRDHQGGKMQRRWNKSIGAGRWETIFFLVGS